MQISQPPGGSAASEKTIDEEYPSEAAENSSFEPAEKAQNGTAKLCLMEMSMLKDCRKIVALPHAYN